MLKRYFGFTTLSGVFLDAFADLRRHARMILSGIHDFWSLQAGFPTKPPRE
jgi:hypothetical protein